MRPEDKIVFDFVAAANAAIAQDAGVVIDGDGQGRIIQAARDGTFGEAGLRDAGVFRERFQFAIAGLLLARAGRRMIGHQQFEQRFARAENFWRLRFDFHARLDGAHAGSGEDARAGVDDTQAADSDGSFVLQMAQRGNSNAVDARGVKHACSRRDRNGLAVNRDADERRR